MRSISIKLELGFSHEFLKMMLQVHLGFNFFILLFINHQLPYEFLLGKSLDH